MDTDEVIINEITLADGPLLVVRKLTVEDAPAMIEYMNVIGGESDNLLRGKNEFDLTLEQEIERIEKDNNDPDIFMIVGVINGRIIGAAQLHGSSRKRIAHNSEMAISVRKEYWRKGVGTALMGELINHAKQRGTTKNISLGVRAGNSNAIKLYEKFGFEKIGFHKDYFNVDGTFYDEILMDLYLNQRKGD